MIINIFIVMFWLLVLVFSGIIAAKTAAKNNLKTLLLDEKNEIGGSTIYPKFRSFKNK